MSEDHQDDIQDIIEETELDEEDFQSLLQGKAAWWHFLDAKAQGSLSEEAQVGAASLELEVVGRWAQQQEARKRPKFTPHFTASLRCQSCHAQIPADLTFCVYCGDMPGFERSYRDQIMVIDHIEDSDIFSEVVDLLIQSNLALNPREVWSALAQPPAVFFFKGHDEHAAALTDRLSELGVRAAIGRPEQADVLMWREVVESGLRDKRMVLGSVLVLGLCIALAVLVSPYMLILGAVILAGLFYFQSGRFEQRYEIDVIKILNELTGFDAKMVEQSRRTLASIEDEEVKDLLTVCLMEYYAIWRQLASAKPEVRRVLVHLKEGIDDLMQHILDACDQYQLLHNYLLTHDEQSVLASIEQVKTLMASTDEAQTLHLAERDLESRKKQLRTIAHIQEVLPGFRTRLMVMCGSLESLRSRVVAVTMSKGKLDIEEISLDEILNELDDEVTVFEQTLQEAVEAAGVTF